MAVVLLKPPKNKLAPLVDELEEIKTQIDELRAREAEIKAVLLESGKEQVLGTHFKVLISRYSVTKLDTAKIRRDMPPAWIKKYSRSTKATRVSIEKRKIAKEIKERIKKVS